MDNVWEIWLQGTTLIRIRNSFNLNDIGSINNDSDYTVVFPQVKRLNDRQIEIIRRSLKMRKEGFKGHGMDELSEKIQNYLKIDTDMYPITFLTTILKDYEHIHNKQMLIH